MLSRLCVGPLSAAVVITKYGAAHGSFAALMLLLLHQQSADDATDMGGSSQLRGMGVEDSNNFESHLFQCHLPHRETACHNDYKDATTLHWLSGPQTRQAKGGSNNDVTGNPRNIPCNHAGLAW